MLFSESVAYIFAITVESKLLLYACRSVITACIKNNDIHIIVLSLTGMSSLLETQKDLENIGCNWSGRLEARNNSAE